MTKFEKPAQVINRELEELRGKGVVSKFRKAINDPHWGKKVPKGPLPEVTVGVAFRTDGNGKVHGDHDVRGLLAINELPGAPCRVNCIALPRGASGSATPHRNALASLTELDGIDLLFIPGAPAAPVSQVASSSDPVLAAEELNFNRKTDPGPARPPGNKAAAVYDTARREYTEFTSRAPYEARIINIARLRGVPILAICAGSWRLLESYGGKVRSLPLQQRSKHKEMKSRPTAAEVWAKSHGVKTLPGTMVGGKGPEVGGSAKDLANVNSTHWAVACIQYNAKRKELGLASADPTNAQPDQLLEIAAFATDPVAATVEAFESRYGAPTLGIQWHPETYLPGMPGEQQGSPEGREHARSLFLFIAGAALAAKQRRTAIGKSLARESEAFATLCEAARAANCGNAVGTANLIQHALRLIPRTDWTPRMLLLDQAIDLLYESSQAKGDVGSANLYIEAMAKLRELGIKL